MNNSIQYEVNLKYFFEYFFCSRGQCDEKKKQEVNMTSLKIFWLMTIKLNPVFLILVLLHNRFKSLQAPSRVFCGLVVLAAVSATQASRSPAARAAAGRRRFRRPAAAATEKASPFRSPAAAKERREACRRHRWATGVKRSWRQIQVGKDDDSCI